MERARAYEVQVRVRLRVLAAGPDAATQIVSEDLLERLTPVLDELHGADPRLAAWAVHADELVDELD